MSTIELRMRTPSGRMNRIQTYLDRNLGLILSQSIEISAGAHGSYLRAIGKRRAILRMATAEAVWHEHVDRLPDHLLPGVPEEPLGLGVH
jgi:hypothetical protein